MAGAALLALFFFLVAPAAAESPPSPLSEARDPAVPVAITQDGLIEYPGPIIVDRAAGFVSIGDEIDLGSDPPSSNPVDHRLDHNVGADVQAAMEEHSALIRAEAARVEARTTGVPPPNFAASYGGITATYNSSFPAPSSVRTVVDAAVNRWDTALSTNPSGPIEVEVYWSDLGNPLLLGYAGPDGMYTGGGLPAGSLHPAPLANTLLGLDANGGSRPEIQVVLNSELLDDGRWYLGTTGNPTTSQVDLYSVVLHEVGHGLGFLGSATIPSGSSSPGLQSPPYVFDTVAVHNGSVVTQLANQAAALLSGDVHGEISEGQTYELYAPASWAQGSSFSHFDETAYASGTPGSLMTPVLLKGETARTLDSATLGLLAQLGWPMAVKAATPSITGSVGSLTSVSLTWNQNLGQTGIAPDSYEIQAWRDGTTLQSTATVSGSAVGGAVGSLTPGASYTVQVVPSGPSGAGTAAVASVDLPAASGPASPESWPDYIRNLQLDGQINRLYQAYFLRLADESGWSYWLDQRARAVSLLDISSAFAASAEFQARYGSLNDASFVDLVYANVLGREADAGGRAYWISQLAGGMDRGEVMIGFAESAEFVTRTGTVASTGSTEGKINRLYQAFFLREPDAEGLAYWKGQAESGVALEAIASAFVQSAEFQARYGSLNNGDFVELVYSNVLNREPDAGGLAYWTGALDDGLDRGSAMVGFSESVEFIKTTGTIP